MNSTTTTETPKRAETLNRLVRPFGIAAAALFTGFAGLQIALALGAPWGDHVWGGAFTGQLSVGMRLVSALAAVVLLGMATAVLARAGAVRRFSGWRPLTGVTWGIAGYMALNTIGNLASQSDVERYVFGRATFVLAALTAFVAYRGPRTGRS